MDYFKKRTQKKPNKKNNPNKKNEQLKTIQTSLIKLLFFTERMNFLLQNEQFVEQNFWKTMVFLLDKQLFLTNVWKTNDNFENEQNQFFWTIEKNEQNGSFTNNKRTKWKKFNILISTYMLTSEIQEILLNLFKRIMTFCF